MDSIECSSGASSSIQLALKSRDPEDSSPTERSSRGSCAIKPPASARARASAGASRGHLHTVVVDNSISMRHRCERLTKRLIFGERRQTFPAQSISFWRERINRCSMEFDAADLMAMILHPYGRNNDLLDRSTPVFKLYNRSDVWNACSARRSSLMLLLRRNRQQQQQFGSDNNYYY